MKSKKWIVLGLLVAVVAGASVWWFSSRKTETITYREDQAKIGDIDVTVLSTGSVKPENRLEVKPPIAGRVEKVLVNEGDKVRRGQTLVTISSSERAALLDAAHEQGPEEVKKWEELYKPAAILAPVSGTIISRKVDPGQSFQTSDAVLVMSDRLVVEASVDETDLAKVKVGQHATITLDAYPDDDIEATVGSVAYEATVVNNVTTYIVKVFPKEVPDFMRSGMTANVTFDVDSRKNVLVVPAGAITDNGASQTVLVKDPSGGPPISRVVKTGLSNGKRTEITDGLKDGDVVLTKIVAGSAKGAGKPSAGGSSSPFGLPRMPRH